jgi:cellulose biosynthesis protein BcsQ
MRTIAFYSYKGGVGRSLLVANLGSRLALLGKRVVLIDLDLEAPGLHYKFPVKAPSEGQANGTTSNEGVLGFLGRHRLGGRTSSELQGQPPHEDAPAERLEISVPVSGQGSLSLISAGPKDFEAYWIKLAEIDLALWAATDPGSLAAAAEALVEHCKNELDADFVLIDCRTGVTDTNAIGLVAMADDVVGVAMSTDEQLSGLLAVLSRLGQRCSVVLSRMPPTLETKRTQSLSNREDLARVRIHNQLPGAPIYRLTWDRFVELDELIALRAWQRPNGVGELFDNYLELSHGLFPELVEFEKVAADSRVTELQDLILEGSSDVDAEAELVDLAEIHHSLNAWNVRARIARIRGDDRERIRSVAEGMRIAEDEEMSEALTLLTAWSQGRTAIYGFDTDFLRQVRLWLQKEWVPRALAATLQKLLNLDLEELE